MNSSTAISNHRSVPSSGGGSPLLPHFLAVAVAAYIVLPSSEILVQVTLGVSNRRTAELLLIAVVGSALVALFQYGSPRRLFVGMLFGSMCVAALFAGASDAPYRGYGLSKPAVVGIFILLPALMVMVQAVFMSRSFLNTLAVIAAPFAVMTDLVGFGLVPYPQFASVYYQSNSVWFGRTLALGGLAALIASDTNKRMLLMLVIFLPSQVFAAKSGPQIAFVIGAGILLLNRAPGHAKLVYGVASIAIALFLIGDSAAVSSAERFTASQVNSDQNGSMRIQFLHESKARFLQHPLAGTGIGSFQSLDRGHLVVYPHNLVAEVAAERGFIGLFLLVPIIAALLRRRRGRLYPLALASFIVAMTSGGLVENLEWPLALAALIASSEPLARMSRKGATTKAFELRSPTPRSAEA